MREFLGTILESGGGRVRARLIREGVSKNGNRWTRKVLEGMVKLLDGVPIHFYDMSESNDGSLLAHWASLRAKLPPAIARLLPERLTEATVGYIRNAKIVDDGGVAAIESDIEIPGAAGWFRSFLESVKAVGRQLGLSIHVPPDGLTGKAIPEGGLELESVSRIVGFDVVTFPSAGGAFEAVLEALQEERQMKDLITRLLRHLPKEKRAALESASKRPTDEVGTIKALCEGYGEWVAAFLEAVGVKIDAAAQAPVLEALAATAPAADPATPKKKATTDPPARLESGEPDDDKKPALDPKLKSMVEGLDKSVKDLLKTNGKSVIESAIAGAKLPEGVSKFANEQLSAVLEAQGTITSEYVEKFVAGLKKGIGDGQANDGTGMLESARRSSLVFPEFSNRDEFIAAVDGLLEGKPFGEVRDKDGKLVKTVPAFNSIRRLYGIATGDVMCEGRDFYARKRRIAGVMEGMDLGSIPMFQAYMAARGGGISEAMTTASFPLLLSDRAHKILAKEWLSQAMQWKLVARSENVSDFKTWRIDKMGEFPNFAAVAEDALYVDAGTTPSEEEVTLLLAKRGGLTSWTWEMILNDDTGKIKQTPLKFARAADRTLNEIVFALITANTAIYDTIALGHATHANLTASAISAANLVAMRKKMVLQKDLDAREAGRVYPRNVLCGPSVYDLAYPLIYSDKKPVQASTDTNVAAGTVRTGTIENPNQPNILRGDYGLQLHEILYYETGDADAYTMVADPNVAEMMVVGFLNGRENPELFVQDLDRVGSFFDRERITLKCRHVYKAVVSDYRGFQLGIP
jgi:hypothetical protein